ncbi:MAG: SDR family oxidoreductase [Xanthomonadales bacterium]|nr:SDR family oxidoreductase [Xanthomonadales bacterium]
MSAPVQVALVTGASRGIGLAVSEQLAASGLRVALLARDAERLEARCAGLREAGRDVLACPADVTDFEQVVAVVEQTEQRLGPIDILVNNAGLIEPIAALAEADMSQWSRLIDVNLKGPANLLRAVLPGMRERGRGTIIQLGSGAAQRPLEGWSAYCASKAALRMLSRCAHAENADRGIRVISLSPGTVATDMMSTIRDSGVNPVSQLDWSAHIPPAWVAHAVHWLCGPGGDTYAGEEFELRSDAARRQLGLPLNKS